MELSLGGSGVRYGVTQPSLRRAFLFFTLGKKTVVCKKAEKNPLRVGPLFRAYQFSHSLILQRVDWDGRLCQLEPGMVGQFSKRQLCPLANMCPFQKPDQLLPWSLSARRSMTRVG